MQSVIALEGKKGLVVGIANNQSIAYGCAKAFYQAGADLALTYLNAKAEPYVRPLAEELASPIILPCDVREQGQLEALFETITKKWGRLDFLLHSIAFAPLQDLHGRVVDCSAEGFALAMDISCHSFIRMAKLAEPLMKEGGSLLTLSYYGGEKVFPNYGMMGPVKAALESTSRYLASELGPQGIRVNVLSPGPLKTRAASGIKGFDEMLEEAANFAPLHRLVTTEDVGALATLLVSDASRNLTGNTFFVDAGYHILG